MYNCLSDSQKLKLAEDSIKELVDKRSRKWIKSELDTELDSVRKALDFVYSFCGKEGKIIRDFMDKLIEDNLQLRDKCSRSNMQIRDLKNCIRELSTKLAKPQSLGFRY